MSLSGIDLAVIISVVITQALLSWRSLSHSRWILTAVPVTLIVLILLRLLLKPIVWTILPAFIVGAAEVLYCLYLIRKQRKYSAGDSHNNRKSTFMRQLGASALAVLLAVIAAAPPILLPVFTLEQPPGSYAIGTAMYHWSDESRMETVTDNPSDHRELTVQVWYPADLPSVTGLQRAPYLPEWDAMAPALAKRYHFPAFLLSHLKQIQSHGYADAPVSASQSRYPVVLFSHGLPGLYATNTFLFEALASSGYIVVSINHTYYSIASALQDGSVVTMSSGSFPSPADWDANDSLIADVWAKDASFVLDRLTQLNAAGEQSNFPLAGHLDLNHIGMAGHSFGGANAVEMLYTDNRIQAAVNMDGTIFGTGARSAPLRKPLLLLQSKRAATDEVPSDSELSAARLTRAQYDKLTIEIPRRETNAMSAPGSRTVVIPGADHLAFTDLYRLSPVLPLMNHTGDLDEIHHRIADEVIPFFNMYLRPS
ncbi:hypothetical protein H8B09_28590 [Paenibacillus sp. PR3]|uniref:Carboxylic ester hydrolase n=1 Tax=Paenibacillus terricola TaxID=2763503 RepID=A0ABR8N5H6_9BACL|nr:hypothetical protein [Paenibacillus terricola]MBD3922702.1 hypothetical protein [Paenibacillus terricola]